VADSFTPVNTFTDTAWKGRLAFLLESSPTAKWKLFPTSKRSSQGERS